MKKSLLNILSVILIVFVAYYLSAEIVTNWEAILDYPFRFNKPILALASLAYAGSLFVLAWGWHVILRYLKNPIPFVDTLLYFFVTQPAKYIPGKIWLPVARTKFCKKHTVSTAMTFLTTGIEGVFEILAGTYISLLAILQTPALGRFALIGTICIVLFGIIILIPKVFYALINVYLRLTKHALIPIDQRVSFFRLFGLQCIYLLGMLGLGLAQLLFLQSFAPVSSDHFAFVVSVGSFTYVASILAFFTPGGLGVREGVWVRALKTIATKPVTLIYAFSSRLWTIIVELILALLCLPFLWMRRHR